MKKLIPGILALMMCFGCLAGCDQIKDKIPFLPNNDSSTPASDDSSTPGDSSTPDTPTQAHAAELANVRALVFADMLEASNTANKSYTVPNSYEHDGKLYDVSWTVTDADGNAVAGVSVQEGDSNDTIIVNVTGADVKYDLTGTITCPDKCCSISHTFHRVAQEVPVPVAITEAPQEGVAYKFHVWQPAKNGGTDCYLTGGMKNTHYLESTPDYSASIDLYVKNVDGGFYLYHVVDGKNVYIHVIKSGSHTNAKYWTLDEIKKEEKDENATPSVWTLDSEWGTIATTLADSKYYLGCDGSYDTVEPQYSTDAGYYKGYLCTMKSKSEVVITDEKKVKDTLDTLSFAEKYTLDKENQILATSGSKYAEVAITWAVDGEGAVLESGNILSFIIPTEATTVTVTATASCGDYSESKPFTIQLGPKSVEVADKTDVAAIWAAANNLAHGETLPGFYTFTGTITSVDTPWDSGYSNITVTFKVNDDITMKCYRLKSGEADASALKVGDVITVNGQLTNHYDKIQFGSGCTLQAVAAGEGGESGGETPDVPVDGTSVIPEAGKAYAFGMTHGNLENAIYYLAGGMDGFYMATTTDINSAIATYIEATTGGYYFYTYVDDVKTYINMVVSGTHVNGAYEATASTVYTIDEENKTLIAVVNEADYWFGTRNDKTYTTMGPCAVSYAGFFGEFYLLGDEEVVPPAGGDDSSSDVTPDDSSSDVTPDDSTSDVTPDDSTSGDSSSTGGETGGDETPDTPDVPEYAPMSISEALSAAVNTKVEISGTVSEIYQAWNDQYSNMSVYITDGTARIIVFRASVMLGLGDVITVKGVITAYNEVNQIAQGSTIEITEKHVCTDFNAANCQSPATCTVCAAAQEGSTAVDHVYEEGACKWCGAPEGVATITASKTVADLITEYGWTNTTTKQSFNLDENVTVKVNGGSNTGKAYDGNNIRIYATDSPAGTLTISVPEGYELLSVKISCQTGTYAFLYVGDGTTDISNVLTTVSGSSVVLKSVKNGSNGKQVRVTALEVTYKTV